MRGLASSLRCRHLFTPFSATRVLSTTSIPSNLPIHSRYSKPIPFPRRSRILYPRKSSKSNPQTNPDAPVQDLRVPDHWLLPSKALEESDWLRVNLHKWLDDEYCPEETNVEISRVAAKSYYQSLLDKETDLGEILLKMARELESISYKDSFHGAFSSANAAINLICQRIELQGDGKIIYEESVEEGG